MAEPLLAISIDLDALDLYMGIFGVQAQISQRARELIPARAVERFGDLCASLGVKGTLFVVGHDVAGGQGVSELRSAVQAGHEVGSHSFAHDYALSRQSPDRIATDLAAAEDAIERAVGVKPVGFRAPGYTLSRSLLSCVAKRGYAYDSSLLPSPPYYAVKAAVVGALTATGRESRSILGPVAPLFGSRGPRRTEGVLELPVTVLPGMRVPFYGTLLTSAPDVVTGTLGRLLRWDRLVVIELHGIDLCDASDGIPEQVLSRQRDARIPATVKRRRLESVLRTLVARRRAVTLAQAAELVR